MSSVFAIGNCAPHPFYGQPNQLNRINAINFSLDGQFHSHKLFVQSRKYELLFNIHNTTQHTLHTHSWHNVSTYKS